MCKQWFIEVYIPCLNFFGKFSRKSKINEGMPEFVNSNFPLVNSSGKPEELEPLVMGSWGHLRKDKKRWRKPYCFSRSARSHYLHSLMQLNLGSPPPLQVFARTEKHCTGTRRHFHYFSCFIQKYLPVSETSVLWLCCFANFNVHIKRHTTSYVPLHRCNFLWTCSSHCLY